MTVAITLSENKSATQIRIMREDEAKTVQQLGRRAFSSLESLFISLPKEAIVAIEGEKIVGAVILKLLKGEQGVLIGDFSAGFVDPACRGRGIASQLYKAATKRFWELGCTFITAQVKDENAGSWRALEKSGFARVTYMELRRLLGIRGLVSVLKSTPTAFAYGMDLYLAARTVPVKKRADSNLLQIATYILLNLIMVCTALLLNRQLHLGWFLLAYGALLIGELLFTRIGLISEHRWNFRLTNCGFIIPLLVPILGGVFPMLGNWIPEKYENTSRFRWIVGGGAVMGWIYLLLTVALSKWVWTDLEFTSYLYRLGSILLIYKLLPVYPFEGFGSLRVYRMNKFIYSAMAAISLVVLFLL
ncbi:GNAT family N-acetyltransferase [Paenibacillus antibioticophila]|uniref:GNAT family N-acetyltransferase n=1 Tax=Paenibacillus antibioticophila TaxID=1274374 RepID=UPI0005C95366|nr:GNAT family N-acetyltransferase [Paenibacillus antibioticophila]